MKHTTTNATQQNNVSRHWGISKLYIAVILLALCFSVSDKANAQSPDFVWAKQIEGYGYGTALNTDASGNVYSTGSFAGTVDFDPGAGVYNLTGIGADEGYVSKLNSSGDFVWAKAFLGPGGTACFAITLDASGNVYTAGTFNGTADFDPGSGIYNLTATGGRDIFISKLDSSGNFVWAEALNGNSLLTSNNGPYEIVIDPANDNVYISGWLYGTTDFDPGAATFNLSSSGGSDIFICKLSSSGNFLWAKSWGSVYDDGNFSIALDNSGNVYVPGGFQGTVDFDPGAGTFNLTSVDSVDISLSKFDNSGNFIWAITMGGLGFEAIGYVAVDNASGDIYATGYFDGTVDFDPGAGSYNLTSNGDWDVFIIKLDASGNFGWARSIGGSTFDIVEGLALDITPSKDVYITGGFTGTIDFDPGPATILLASTGEEDIFISKFDSSGNYKWAKKVGGNDGERSQDIAISVSGNACITGYFFSTSIAFGSTNFINVNGGADIFIAKLDVLSGIENLGNTNSISIYPNPAKDLLTINYALLSGIKVNIIINDITGKIIYKTTTFNSENLDVNTSEFAEGVYLVQIQTEKFIETKKVIISK